MLFHVNRRVARALTAWILISHSGALLPWALSAPEGGRVASGRADISAASGVTQVNQLTDKVIVNWSGFSTATGETVRFNQPSASAVALNRVTSGSSSALNGALEANGRVFILNPNGIIFGRGATVNAAGLVASTLSMKDDDFLAGRYALSQDPGRPLGAVINRGTITAGPGGSVALVAPAVSNEGSIRAPGGRIALTAGRDALVNLDGAGLVNLAVKVGPRGAVVVPGGQAADVLSTVVNNQHLVEAGSVSESGGVVTLGAAEGVAVNSGSLSVDAASGQAGAGAVRLQGEQAALVVGQGVLSARGAGAGQLGGRVEVLGGRVGLLDTARVDASGAAGGGHVNLGGARSGGPGLPRASALYVGAEAVAIADATDKGNGGEVIAFSAGATRVNGQLAARGAARGGDGGFVETSGATVSIGTHVPDVSARARGNANSNSGSGGASSANGNSNKPGTWLIDPGDVTIVAGFGKSKCIVGPPNFQSNACDACGGTVGACVIDSALRTQSVIVKAVRGVNKNGDVNVQNLINYNASGAPTSLTLEADHDINIGNVNAGIRPAIGTAHHAVFLSANLAGTNGRVNIGGQVDTGGDSFSSTGADLVVGSSGSISTQSASGRLGDITLSHTGNAVIAGSIVGSNNVVLAANSVQVSGSIIANNQLQIIGGGDVSATGSLGATNELGITTAGVLTLVNAGSSGAVVLAAEQGASLTGVSAGRDLSAKVHFGDLTVGFVFAQGNVTLLADHGNIVGTGRNCQVDGSSIGLLSGHGVVGSTAQPFNVNTNGHVAVGAAGSVGGVSAVLAGNANAVIAISATPGEVIFNGAALTTPPKRTVISLAFFDPQLAIATYGQLGVLAVQAIQTKNRALARALLRFQPGDDSAAASLAGIGAASLPQVRLTPQETAELNAIFGTPAATTPPPMPAPIAVAPPAPAPAPIEPQVVALATTPEPTPVPGGTPSFGGTGAFGFGGLGGGLSGGAAGLGGGLAGAGFGMPGAGFGALGVPSFSPSAVAALASAGGTAPSASLASLGDLSGLGGTGASPFASFSGFGLGGFSGLTGLGGSGTSPFLFSLASASISGGTGVSPAFTAPAPTGGTAATGTGQSFALPPGGTGLSGGLPGFGGFDALSGGLPGSLRLSPF